MTDLYRRNGGEPEALPFEAQTPSGEWRTDLANHPSNRAECGYVLAPAKPAFDPSTQMASWDIVAERWRVTRLPVVPAPAPVYAPLTRLAFIRLCETAGGMTPVMKVAAYKNPAFEAFWIDFQMAEEIARDDPSASQALTGLEASGYLPKGAAEVLRQWPRQ